MAKFIRVHDAKDNTPVIINTDEVLYVSYDKSQKKAVIRMNLGIQCTTHETQDDIWRMMNA